MEMTSGGFRFTVLPETHPRFWQRFASGTWEPQTLALMARLLRPGTRLVDVGAWIGPTTLLAAAIGARVDAFECDPVALDKLRANLGVNPDIASRVRVLPFALAEECGMLQVWSRALGNSETSIYNRHERRGVAEALGTTLEVPALDARAVFRHEGYAASPDTLVKIDIEGSEFRIAARLRPLIATSRCIWYVSLHERNLVPHALPKEAVRAGEVLSFLAAFEDLNWYDAALNPINKAALCDLVLHGQHEQHGSYVFSSKTLAP